MKLDAGQFSHGWRVNFKQQTYGLSEDRRMLGIP